jgi:hypothetical protein
MRLLPFALSAAAAVVLLTARLPGPAAAALRAAPPEPDLVPMLVRIALACAIGAGLALHLTGRRRAWP